MNGKRGGEEVAVGERRVSSCKLKRGSTLQTRAKEGGLTRNGNEERTPKRNEGETTGNRDLSPESGRRERLYSEGGRESVKQEGAKGKQGKDENIS